MLRSSSSTKLQEKGEWYFAVLPFLFVFNDNYIPKTEYESLVFNLLAEKLRIFFVPYF